MTTPHLLCYTSIVLLVMESGPLQLLILAVSLQFSSFAFLHLLASCAAAAAGDAAAVCCCCAAGAELMRMHDPHSLPFATHVSLSLPLFTLAFSLSLLVYPSYTHMLPHTFRQCI